ncbi:MAG: HD domain-containing protein [Candidatus Omnitrophica bacterium]|nr:HD domain-containing protein [Candidatus Omnitrophota bacterium]
MRAQNKTKSKREQFTQRGKRLFRLEEFAALYEVNKSITSTLKLPQVLNLITTKACQIMRAKGCSLRLLHKNRKELILEAHYGLNKRSHLRKGNIKIGESIAGRVLKEDRPFMSKDLFKDPRYQHSFIARKENLRSLLSVPLVERGKTFGVLSIYNSRPRSFHKEDSELLSMFASFASIAISNARLYEKAKANYLGAIRFLANALDAKDSYTAGHSERVAKIALEIACQLRLSELQKDALQYASYLHDLGKVTIDIATLRKPGRLTQLEWKSIYRHPQVGAEIISKIEALSTLVPIILYHHARYAGGGYPDENIKSDKIPISSRILAVADAFEAMVSHRPYQKAFSKEEARNELKRCSGMQFDPIVVNAFLKIQSPGFN